MCLIINMSYNFCISLQEQLKAMDDMSVRVSGQTSLPIPNHILDRMHVYRKYVDVADGEVMNAFRS